MSDRAQELLQNACEVFARAVIDGEEERAEDIALIAFYRRDRPPGPGPRRCLRPQIVNGGCRGALSRPRLPVTSPHSDFLLRFAAGRGFSRHLGLPVVLERVAAPDAPRRTRRDPTG